MVFIKSENNFQLAKFRIFCGFVVRLTRNRLIANQPIAQITVKCQASRPGLGFVPGDRPGCARHSAVVSPSLGILQPYDGVLVFPAVTLAAALSLRWQFRETWQRVLGRFRHSQRTSQPRQCGPIRPTSPMRFAEIR